MKKRQTVIREVTVTICDLCGNDERHCDECEGCGRDVCYNCHVTMYPSPFGEDETGKAGLTACGLCRQAVEPYAKAVKELNEKHEQERLNLKKGWVSQCKRPQPNPSNAR